MKDERKATIKKQILERLVKNFTISSVCNAVGIDRKTFYRWCDEDLVFKNQAYENIQESKKDITDMAYTRLVKLIANDNLTAIMFWLNNKDPEINNRTMHMNDDEVHILANLLNNPETFNKGQELLMTYVMKGKISEKYAQVILRLFITGVKVEDLNVRKTESEILNEVLFRKKNNKLRRK